MTPIVLFVSAYIEPRPSDECLVAGGRISPYVRRPVKSALNVLTMSTSDSD